MMRPLGPCSLSLLAVVLLAAPLTAQPNPTPAVTLDPGFVPGVLGFLQFGDEIVPIDDLDGDGTPDVLVTAPGYCPTSACQVVGRVYAYSGATGAVLYTIDPSPARTFFAASLAVGPDLDGDGTPEVVTGGNTFAYVFSGADGAQLAAFNSRDPDALFSSAAWVPDVDGDGVGDAALGAPSASNDTGTRTGAVTLISGASFEQIARTALPDAAGEARFGGTVALLGDTDADGTPELVVSADDEDSSTVPDGGRVYTVELIAGLAEAPVLLAEGAEASGLFGIALAVLDDVDADGVRDLVVTGQAQGARAPFVVSGATGAVLYPVQDPVGVPGADLGIGAGLAGTGDLDGDGVGDFVVGDPVSILPDFRFSANFFAFSGATGALLQSVADPDDDGGPLVVNQFALNVASVGDLDGDGTDDVAASSEAEGGLVYLYLSPQIVASDPVPPASALALSVSPNPARGRLRLQTDAPGVLVVADALGRTVYRADVGVSAEIGVDAWAPGVYLARVTRDGVTVSRSFTVAH